MRLEEFLSLTAGADVIFDGKHCIISNVKCVSKVESDTEADSLSGERLLYKSLHAAKELELSYVDCRTGRIQRLCLVVFPDCPGSPQNEYVLSRIKRLPDPRPRPMGGRSAPNQLRTY